jgi:hypothetical protein
VLTMTLRTAKVLRTLREHDPQAPICCGKVNVVHQIYWRKWRNAPQNESSGEMSVGSSLLNVLRKQVDEVPDAGVAPPLPTEDNTPEGLAALLRANNYYRNVPWPMPFGQTKHRLRHGDARDLSWIPNASVHLIVTSPPYWTLKKYEEHECQLGAIAGYNDFLDELDKVWRECARVLVDGGRICCIVGDVCIPRKAQGRHYIMPLHSDIQIRARRLGLDCLTPILWHKIANGVTEAEGNEGIGRMEATIGILFKRPTKPSVVCWLKLPPNLMSS